MYSKRRFPVSLRKGVTSVTLTGVPIEIFEKREKVEVRVALQRPWTLENICCTSRAALNLGRIDFFNEKKTGNSMHKGIV